MINIKAFTLVELIVVVTILAILSTIGFVSYSGYLAGVRDTNRVAQLKAIGDAMHLYSTNKSLPTPDDKIDIKVGTGVNEKIISYQGYVGKDTINTVGYTAEGLDPKDKTYFSYYLTKDKKYFQLMAYLEEEQLSTSRIKLNNKVQAEIDYETRYPRVEGTKLGILTGTGADLNKPLQELVTGELNIEYTTNEYISNIDNSSKLVGTGITLQSLDNVISSGGIGSTCKFILDKKSSLKGKDGIYVINPDGNNPLSVYCDMTTDGGGWTIIASDGLSANNSILPDLGIIPTPTIPGLVLDLVTNKAKEKSSEMMVINVDDKSKNVKYDISGSWLGDLIIENSGYGFLYESDKGFSGGKNGTHKCNFGIIILGTGGCTTGLSVSYPANGESLGAVIGNMNPGHGVSSYSWQFSGNGNEFRLGRSEALSSGYYNNRLASYLMIR